ncbi:MAG: hypothetical protein AVDCRST_MAG69-2645, partial [uncultured Solirubrobacteraceae bacterium]
ECSPLPLLRPAGDPGARRSRARLRVPQRGLSRVRPAAALRRAALGRAESGTRRGSHPL